VISNSRRIASRTVKTNMPYRLPRRLRRRHSGAYSALCALAFLAMTVLSCDTPGIRLVNPDVSDSSAGVTFRVTLEDSGLAEALGWEGGVPGALISYHRISGEAPIRTVEADSSGSVVVRDMLPGRYRLAAYRVLQEDETGPTGGQIRAFGDGLIRSVYPSQLVELTLRADRRGSIVISEVRIGTTYQGSGSIYPEYDYFGYFELYNNGETTIYLDGMLWGNGFTINKDGGYSCESTALYRNDPQDMWVRYLRQFPGSGTDYPLAPGETAVIAQDAVDHSVVHPSFPDLTGADFELRSLAGVDNPDVPNMPDVGTRGIPFYLETICSMGCFLAEAADVAFLPIERLPFFGGSDWMRVPVESILDVLTTDIWTPTYDQFDPCVTKVHRSLDRLEEPEYEVSYDVSMSTQRRVLWMGPGGFPLLQDVGVSFWDFELAARSPGWIEY